MVQTAMNLEDIKKIAVIGAGDMGNGIAACFLFGGYHVALYDIEQRFIERGVEGIRKSFDKLKTKGAMTPENYDRALANLTATTDLREAAGNADFLIEAIPENLDLKQRVFADLDRYSPRHAILASNTSNIRISAIGEATQRPDRVMGYHFSNPAMLMKMVEVIKGDRTAEEAIQLGYDLAKKIGKTPVIVKKDSPGFIFNRVNRPRLVLLSKILDAGCPTPEEFDGAFKGVMPMAPFELLDYVGIDIAVDSLEYLAGVLSPDYRPSAALMAYVTAGHLGKKTGRGFYDWSQGRPQIDLSRATKDYDLDHLTALRVNEATKLLEEGVVDDPREIDLAMTSGSGLPLGPFAEAQKIGYATVIAKLNDIYRRFPIDLFKATETLRTGNVVV